MNVFNHLWHLSGVVCSVSFCLSWHGKQYNVSVSRLTTPFKKPCRQWIGLPHCAQKPTSSSNRHFSFHGD
ncbi:hypothetical protein I656_00039 [Geobacillus sp. WSUCF1]|nr:hypothetical protein I656_00039 [Geobacillus sp. WSUCF1]